MKFRHLLGYLAAALIAAAPMTIAAYADEIYDWSSTAANNNSAPPAGFPENMNYSEVNDAARELMAVVKRQIEATDGTNTTSGTEPAYTLTSGQSLGAAAGHVHVWTAHATSTGSVTLNVDAAGAKNVVDAFGTQLGSGAIVSGGVYMSVEEASTHQVIGTFSAPPVGGPASSTDNAIVRFNGIDGQVLQNSGVVVDDSNNISGATAVDIGNADTTLSRASAGDINVEGNIAYRAGGTDVPVTDGGTGRSASTAYALITGGTTSTGAQQSVSGVGTSGQVLESQGAGALPAWATLPAFGMQSVQTFTASGTWTRPAGVTKILVIVTGGGGGGGDAGTTNVGSGGGASGATAIEFIDVTGTSSETVTIGAGGPGGTLSGNGTAGGTTSFGIFCSANGGAANNGSVGGASSTASGGDINISGGSGGYGGDRSTGEGGGSFWGSGGATGGSPAGGQSGIDGEAYGSGGGGGFSFGSTKGGDGADGVVFVLEFGG